MTMRKRVLSIRLSDTEYQALKTEAEKAGTSPQLTGCQLSAMPPPNPNGPPGIQ